MRWQPISPWRDRQRDRGPLGRLRAEVVGERGPGLLDRHAVEQHPDGTVDGDHAADAPIGSRPRAWPGGVEENRANELRVDCPAGLKDCRGECRDDPRQDGGCHAGAVLDLRSASQLGTMDSLARAHDRVALVLGPEVREAHWGAVVGKRPDGEHGRQGRRHAPVLAVVVARRGDDDHAHRLGLAHGTGQEFVGLCGLARGAEGAVDDLGPSGQRMLDPAGDVRLGQDRVLVDACPKEQAAAGGCQAVDSGCGQAEDDRSDVGGVGAGRFLRVAFAGPGHPLDSDVGAHERLMADIRHAVEHRDQDSGITARAAAQLADSG